MVLSLAQLSSRRHRPYGNHCFHLACNRLYHLKTWSLCNYYNILTRTTALGHNYLSFWLSLCVLLNVALASTLVPTLPTPLPTHLDSISNFQVAVIHLAHDNHWSGHWFHLVTICTIRPPGFHAMRTFSLGQLATISIQCITGQ